MYNESMFNNSNLIFICLLIYLFFSGGKDSCYNMMQCVAKHQIVALANLRPAENQGKCIHVLESSLND